MLVVWVTVLSEVLGFLAATVVRVVVTSCLWPWRVLVWVTGSFLVLGRGKPLRLGRVVFWYVAMRSYFTGGVLIRGGCCYDCL